MIKKKYTFIDPFSDSCGFHQAMHPVGSRCVFECEWHNNAQLS